MLKHPGLKKEKGSSYLWNTSQKESFRGAIFNSRGVHTVDPSGKPELELSEKYRKQVDDVENAGYQRLASTLRDLANSYASEARRIIDEHKQEEGYDS